ncbi:MAG: acyl-CoA/acyl-ACP dehydrogenase [Ignavibacteria bacterium]|nr:acyl-CoA/acyl-ACP dehydrogenase [Ignavibacteria bacterium]
MMRNVPILERSAALQKEVLNKLGEGLAGRARCNPSNGKLALGTIQVESFNLARLLSEAAGTEAMVHFAKRDTTGPFEERIALLSVAQSVTSLATALLSNHRDFGITDLDPFEEFLSLANHLRVHCTPESWIRLGEEILSRGSDLSGSPGLDPTHQEFRSMFARFADTVIAPLAEETHRKDRIIPDTILKQIAELGAFGISIPEEYGGSFVDHSLMVIATEELSRASLGAGGSVLTRPEICAKALLAGGTEEQKRKWLPVIASGEKMVCIAVTEPNTGSDVAQVSLSARLTDKGYLLNGEKTWATFAGRSEILCVLARTGAPELGHKGLSLFLVEKPYDQGGDEHHFRHVQPAGGVLEGHAIPTIGYRGMHSFSIAFEDYLVPVDQRIGEEGRGFYLQMQGFAGGRIQTAARAVGVMEAAFREAVSYAGSRNLFGRSLAEFGLTRHKLGMMAVRIQTNRQLALRVAGLMDESEATMEASLVKFLACKDAEWVTREAMQLHGGMGYSEEYPVSRYFVDARVLSIFEGAEEILALQVIARPFMEQFLEPVTA